MSLTQRINTAALLPTECPDMRRLGSPNDGGYVVPMRALERASVLLSFGVAMDWNFERATLAANPALVIHAYDHTVGSRKFAALALRSALTLPWQLLRLSPRGTRRSLRQLQRSLDYFFFFTGHCHHFRQRVWCNDDRGSAGIKNIIARTGVTAPHAIFAKIDIEGSEYRVLPFIAEQARLFSGLVIEFHDTDICAAAFDAQIALLRRDFEIVHTHANNYGDLSVDGQPMTWEVSLLHKDLLDRPVRPYTGPLPRPGLDTPNDPSRPDYQLVLMEGNYVADSVS